MKTLPTFRGQQHKVSFFFTKPSVSPEHHGIDGHLSVLCLLRRELLETMGYSPDTESEEQAWKEGARHRLFASAAVMFTGFDLLAKFEQGDDNRRDVGRRFKNFLRSSSGADLDEDSAEIFWAVRNSITHAFNTPPASALEALGMKHVALAQRRVEPMNIGPGCVFVRREDETATLYMDGVYQVFVDAVKSCRHSLRDRDYPDAWPRFQAMFDKYGTIEMRTSET
jgi:hypothetical protein